MTGDQIKTVITKHNNTKHNMVYLSGFLVSVFRKIVDRSLIAHNQLPFKFHLSIDAIRKYAKDIDNALWENGYQ